MGPCFQIVLLPHSLPYFNKEGGISRKWERIDQGKMVAYKQLSKDDCTLYFHTPNNTLLYIYNLPFTERIKGWIANTEQPLPKVKISMPKWRWLFRVKKALLLSR